MDVNREGWKKPLPEHMARPTYWPCMLALAMTITLLGPVTSMAITYVGLAFGAAALIGWIGEIVNE